MNKDIQTSKLDLLPISEIKAIRDVVLADFDEEIGRAQNEEDRETLILEKECVSNVFRQCLKEKISRFLE